MGGESPGSGGGVGGHGGWVNDRGLLTRRCCGALTGARQSSKAEGIVLAMVEEVASGTSRGICREVLCVLLDINCITRACLVLSRPHRNWVQVRVEQLLLSGWFWAAEDGGTASGGRL